MSSLYFNKREIRFGYANGWKTMKGTMVLYSHRRANLKAPVYLFKSDDGELWSCWVSNCTHYQNGHFSDKPKFLEAMRRQGVVTAAEIEQYKRDEIAHQKKVSKRYFAENLKRLSEESGCKLTKAQKKLIASLCL